MDKVNIVKYNMPKSNKEYNIQIGWCCAKVVAAIVLAFILYTVSSQEDASHWSVELITIVITILLGVVSLVQLELLFKLVFIYRRISLIIFTQKKGKRRVSLEVHIGKLFTLLGIKSIKFNIEYVTYLDPEGLKGLMKVNGSMTNTITFRYKNVAPCTYGSSRVYVPLCIERFSEIENYLRKLKRK